MEKSDDNKPLVPTYWECDGCRYSEINMVKYDDCPLCSEMFAFQCVNCGVLLNEKRKPMDIEKFPDADTRWCIKDEGKYYQKLGTNS